MNQECEKGALHKNLGVSCLAGRGAKSHKKEVCNLEISLRANALYILIYPKLLRKEGRKGKKTLWSIFMFCFWVGGVLGEMEFGS